MVLVVFQFNPVCNFGTFFKFGLGTVRSERVKSVNTTVTTNITAADFIHCDQNKEK